MYPVIPEIVRHPAKIRAGFDLTGFRLEIEVRKEVLQNPPKGFWKGYVEALNLVFPPNALGKDMAESLCQSWLAIKYGARSSVLAFPNQELLTLGWGEPGTGVPFHLLLNCFSTKVPVQFRSEELDKICSALVQFFCIAEYGG